MYFAPALPARDFAGTVEFWVRLGFSTVFRRDAPDAYAVLRRDELELHLFGHPGLEPGRNHAGCYLRLEDADTLYREWQALELPRTGIPRLGPIGDMPWDMREFHLVDPSGNLLRVGHPA